MIPPEPLIALAIALSPIKTGVASQYAPGVMERVVATRQTWHGPHALPAHLPNTDGYVAVIDPAHIGRVIHVRPEGQAEWETFIVADCAGVADGGRAWMLRGGVIIEVDYKTAVRWNTVGRGIDVEVRGL